MMFTHNIIHGDVKPFLPIDWDGVLIVELRRMIIMMMVMVMMHIHTTIHEYSKTFFPIDGIGVLVYRSLVGVWIDDDDDYIYTIMLTYTN